MGIMDILLLKQWALLCGLYWRYAACDGQFFVPCLYKAYCLMLLCNCAIETNSPSWWRQQMEHFPCYWHFVKGIHRWPVNSLHKGQWRWALMFSLIWAWRNGWVNNRDAGDLRQHRAHYDVTVMIRPTITLYPFAATRILIYKQIIYTVTFPLQAYIHIRWLQLSSCTDNYWGHKTIKTLETPVSMIEFVQACGCLLKHRGMSTNAFWLQIFKLRALKHYASVNITNKFLKSKCHHIIHIIQTCVLIP